MNTLLYKRIPTRNGECLIELLALGREDIIKTLHGQLRRKKEKVVMAFIKSPQVITKLQKESFLTEEFLLKTVK